MLLLQVLKSLSTPTFNQTLLRLNQCLCSHFKKHWILPNCARNDHLQGQEYKQTQISASPSQSSFQYLHVDTPIVYEDFNVTTYFTTFSHVKSQVICNK